MRFITINRSDFKLSQVDRVVINEEGEAVSPNRVCSCCSEKLNVKWVFVRDDGWSLGASDKLKPVAEAMWKDEWEVCAEIVED